MDIATIIGLIMGVVLIVLAMLMQAEFDVSLLGPFWEPSSMMIVVGGTVAATAIGFRVKEIVRVFTLIKFVVTKPKYILSDLVKELLEASETYKKGPAELEKHIPNVKTPFIQDGLTFIVNGQVEVGTANFGKVFYNMLNDWLFMNWDQRLGQHLGKGFQTCSSAACHNDHRNR